MELTMTTPAILFPAISLFFMAYTTRFLNIARLARELHDRYNKESDAMVFAQIKNLMKRLILIRNMQILAVGSFFLCVVTIFLIYRGISGVAEWAFAVSLLALMASLLLSVFEIQLSIGAITIEMNDILNKSNK